MAKNLSIPSLDPLYDQIKALITRSLVAGEWKPGEAIPGEVLLAQRFRVSRESIRRAIDKLAAEHVLVRKQGKGTFVLPNPENRQTRLLRLVHDNGAKTQQVSKILDFRLQQAPAEVAHGLRVRPAAPVYLIRRVLLFSGLSGCPLAFDENWVSAALFKDLDMTKLSTYRGSLYSLGETRYGLQIIRVEERVKAVAADESAAVYLEINPDTPLLCVERIAFDRDDKPVEWQRSFCHTAECSYWNHIA